MEIIVFWFNFHLIAFFGVHMTESKHWFRKWLGVKQGRNQMIWESEEFNEIIHHWIQQYIKSYKKLSKLVFYCHLVIIFMYHQCNNSGPSRTVILNFDGSGSCHDDVIKWKHLPRYWPFVRGIHRSPVNSSHKGQFRRALMFSFICA